MKYLADYFTHVSDDDSPLYVFDGNYGDVRPLTAAVLAGKRFQRVADLCSYRFRLNIDTLRRLIFTSLLTGISCDRWQSLVG